MNQRVHNLTKWTFLPEGRALRFENDRQRTVILEVNCPDRVSFYVTQDREAVENDPERVTDEAAGRMRTPQVSEESVSEDAEPPISFLGVAEGRDRFEFAVEGTFELVAEGGSAYVYTFDGQDIATRVVAPVIFTRIANRRARNPQLELMQYQMRINQDRMIRQLEEENERRMQALEEKLEQYAPERNSGTVIGRADLRPRREAVDEAERDDAAGSSPDAVEEEPKRGRKAGKAGKADVASSDDED